LFVAALMLAATLACRGSNSEQRDRYLQDGDSANAAGKTSEAIIAFRNAAQIDPLSVEARLRLADALTVAGDGRAALGEYVRAADLRPDDLELQVRIGNLLLAIGRLQDARSRAEGVLQKNPSHVEAHILLGNALGGYQELDKALAQMEEAIRLDPSRAASHMQLAIVQQARGNEGAAEAELKKAVKLSPKWSGAHLALGSFYLSVGRLPEASSALDAALALEPSHLGAARAKAVLAFLNRRPAEAEVHLKRLADGSTAVQPQIALGDYYLAIGKLPEAVELFERLARDSRNQSAVMPRLVRAYAGANNEKAARDLVARLLQENPNNHAIRTLESQLFLDEGRRDKALASAQMAAKGDPASAAAQFTLGKAYAAVGDRSGAETAFREVLKINPRAVPAQVELSTLSLGEKGGNEALAMADAAAKVLPGNFDARITLIRSLLGTGDLTRAEREIQQLQTTKPTAAGYAQAGALALARFDLAKARAAYDKAIDLDPDSIEALAGQLSLDLREGSGARARARLTERLEGATPRVELLLLAARTYLSLNDLNQSESVLRRAIEVEPASLPAYSMLAQTYLRMKRLDDARAEFDRLAAKQSNPVGALTAAGTILQAQGKDREARERYEKVIGLDPGAAVAANNLAWIYAESGEHLDRAIELAQIALDKLPDVPDVLDTLGWAHYKGATPTLAVRPLARCVEIAPAYAPCHYHLGLVHAKLGDEALAEQHLRTSIRLQANGPWVPDAQRAIAALPSRK
jgi:tetratricopeptide (TPR) repeat protein